MYMHTQKTPKNTYIKASMTVFCFVEGKQSIKKVELKKFVYR